MCKSATAKRTKAVAAAAAPAKPAEKGANADAPLLANFADEELRKRATQLGLSCADDASREKLLAALAPYQQGIAHRWQAPKPLPLARPTVTFNDVRSAIPKHCFERSLAHGLLHLAGDLLQIAALGVAVWWVSQQGLPAWASAAAWVAYWFLQGTVMTGVWVLAHECGHQSFSANETANNTVGLICHSALLVPYHSWRITHGKHHANTGSCEHDEVFCPPTRADVKVVGKEMVTETPLWQALTIVFMLTFGWMPGYLFFNATGPKKYRGKGKSHFNPWAPMFDAKDRLDVAVSDIGFLAALALLFAAIYRFGLATVACYYIAPYMVTNLYLVLITFLQHTDVFLPHFRGKEWDWFRGALCTADRSFGVLIDHVIHHIADTHVCHHLFSKMPFYHAQEATLSVANSLGAHYMRDDTPVPQALWRAYTCCGFIEDEGDVVFYKNKGS